MFELISQTGFSTAVGDRIGSFCVLAYDLVGIILVNSDPLGICAVSSNSDGLVICVNSAVT